MRRASSLLVGLLILGFASTACAEDVIDHSPFTELLQNHVDDQGRVDYAGLADSESSMKKLESYLGDVADAEPSGDDRDARLAFYLNAYNAHVIASIVEHWPTESPQSIDGFFKKKTHEVAGEQMTLDELEHSLIREEFQEPRIHFVLVCAADACPRLRRNALTKSNVEEVIDSAANEFIPRVTEVSDGKVVTSKLFSWFSADFKEAAGSVREYLAKYAEGEVKEALSKEDVEIEFRSYDWSVNEQP